MKQLIIFITLIAVLTAAKTKSAEVIPIWNKVNDAGEIHDMEFLRGEDQFILLAGTGGNSQIQIRQTLTGDLVTSYPMTSFAKPKLAITPDSNRFVITTGGNMKIGATIELRVIDNFSLIKKDSLINTKDEISGEDLFYRFNEIVIDPIRPLAYVILERTNFTTTPPLDSNFLIVYNYETMEKVRDLTPVGFGAEFLSQIAVSKDGKYLAALNDRRAYLKVWDLETYEEIRSVKLWDENLPNDDWSCVSKDIEFSERNSDEIYFSGIYPNSDEGEKINGVLLFSIKDSKIVNNSLKLINSGNIILFNQNIRLYINSGGNDKIINLEGNNYFTEADNDLLKFPSSLKVIYSEENKSFIGTSIFNSGSIKYDSQTGIENNYEEIIISPNPTGSFVNMNLNCSEPQINYQINDVNGLLLFQDNVPNPVNNSLQINFSSYPSGIYFITFNCNQVPKSYKIVKED